MKNNAQIDVKAFRQKHGLSQTQLAKILRVGQPQISRYESGKTIPGPVHYILEQAEAGIVKIEAPA
jgi:transcriptional regulator with XRE-family HTH domain